MVKTFLLALLITVSFYNGFTQTHPLKFNTISELDGVPIGKINSISRDAQGILWLSDQFNRWILRYDGKHATKYLNDPKNPNSLGGIYPECIVADSTGIIWIGFYETGLDRFDPVTGNFTHYRHSATDAGSLANDTVSALLIDHLGNLWVGTDKGLDLLDQKTGKFKHFSHNPNNLNSLSNNIVRAVYEDHEGTVWVGTGFVFSSIIDNNGGLNRFDRKTETFTRFLNDPKNPHSLINNKVRAIFEDSRGNFWVGTAGDGLHIMDRKTGLFERHTYDRDKPNQLSRTAYKGGFDHITFITEDAERQIWIGTYSNGLIRYDPESKKITRFGIDGDKKAGFKDIGPWTAYASKDGLLWISTEQYSLYNVDLFTNSIPVYSAAGSGVNRFYEDSASILWIGTDNGLLRRDLKTGNDKLFQIESSNRNTEVAHTNAISVITRDQQGNFWAGSSPGLYRFDPNSGIFTQFRSESDKNNSLAGGNVICIYQDNETNYWIGTFDRGLYMINTASGNFKHFEHVQGDTSSLSSNLVPNVLQDQTGDLWVAAWNNGGLDRLNAKTGKIRHYLSGNSIGMVVKDLDEVIWVVGANDLYRYNRASDEFTTMSLENPAFDIRDARSLICDHRNNLWIGTARGILKINSKRDRVSLYGKETGIPLQDLNYLSAIETKKGQLLYGGSSGYFPFYPDSLKMSPLVPKITFTNFWIGNEEIKPGKNSVLTDPIFNTKQINLTYKQDIFSFGFSSVDYGVSDNRTILYKLENYDKEWRQAGVESKVYYFNVPPGKYVLKVKAANSINSLWQEKEINIIISPPWWNRWWAWVLFAVAALIILRSYIVFRSRKLRREKQALEEKVNLRTQQLQRSMENLKATQSQLIQSEKMASLGELTAGIAHEIQNPLNFVNNFSEVNVELLNELKDGPLRKLPEEEKKEADSIVEDISQNLEKISFHGKRADGIVKGMLQHSRSSTGVKEPTDINALADEYFRLAYHGLRAKNKSFNATLKTDFDKSLSANGSGNGKINIIPQDIGRVLLNLYNNAFYAVSEKKKQQLNGYEPTVSVITKRTAGKTEIRVKDNGNGIPQKVWDKIFQPFFTTKPTGEGTGLGLSLAYDIIKAHGGELKVETKEGEGTEFIIELPVV